MHLQMIPTPRQVYKLDLLVQICDIIRASKMTYSQISERSHVNANTISRWVSRETKSPQLLKVAAVALALGYTLVLVPTQKGN